MQKGKELLQPRWDYLKEKNILLDQNREKHVEGLLRIDDSKNRPQYYHRTDPKDFNGKYIPVKNIDLARALAQKDYDERAAQAVKEEIKTIERCLNDYPHTVLEDVYPNLSAERQKLVTPLIETDEMLAARWQQVQYKGRGFKEDDPEIYTLRGERVRSKSEMTIANYLYERGIPYRYEFPVKMWNGRIVHPDFLVLNVRERREIIYEHFGEMDEPGYAEKSALKFRDYQLTGFCQGRNLIMTWETKNTPIDMRLLKMIVREHFI
ncbi:MAG: hypothetical protein II787_02570 [Lachnospiraceae bacterium]|nr:hypothetical protein [Lachnospiraceae bacterium]